jgi:hypothetical protein
MIIMDKLRLSRLIHELYLLGKSSVERSEIHGNAGC